MTIKLTTLTEEQAKRVLDDREEARKPSLFSRAVNNIINYFRILGDEMDRANKIYNEMGIWREY